MRSQFHLDEISFVAALTALHGTRRNTFTAYRPQSDESYVFYINRAAEKRIRKAQILERLADAGAIRRHVLKRENAGLRRLLGKPRAKKVDV